MTPCTSLRDTATSYKFDVPNGLYNVALHFAEIYWEAPGQRIFDVFIEGSRVLDRYDICAAVGCNTAHILTFPGVQVKDGQLNIDFVTVKDNAKISAISITSSVSSLPPPAVPPPAVSLTSPTAGASFSPGQVVTATGSGQNLRWDIDRTATACLPLPRDREIQSHSPFQPIRMHRNSSALP